MTARIDRPQPLHDPHLPARVEVGIDFIHKHNAFCRLHLLPSLSHDAHGDGFCLGKEIQIPVVIAGPRRGDDLAALTDHHKVVDAASL